METHHMCHRLNSQVGGITSRAGWVGSIRSSQRMQNSQQQEKGYRDSSKRDHRTETRPSGDRSPSVQADHRSPGPSQALEVNYACTVEPRATILDSAVLIYVLSSLLVMPSSDSSPSNSSHFVSTLPRRQKHDRKKFRFVLRQFKYLESYKVSSLLSCSVLKL